MLGRRNTKDGRPTGSGKPMRRALNKHAFATAMLSSTAPLFLGYELAVMYSTAVIAEADLKILACVVALSMLLGAISAVRTQRLIGDRRTVLLSTAVLCAGALARVLAASSAAFTAGVVVNGVGMGLLLMIVPASAAELSPSSLRGVLGSHPDGFVYLGCIVGSLCYSTGFSKLPPHVAWRLTVASGVAIPALLSAAVLLLPESPRWLVARDQVIEGRRVLVGTSATLEEAELRLPEINDDLGATQDGSPQECAATWRELLARPTEPLRRAVVTAAVAKVFQQASGMGSLLQYERRALRDAGAGASSGAQTPRALAAFGFVVVLSLAASLALVELGWQLVGALAGGCRPRRAPSSRRRGLGMTRRQEQLKWARGLSATMLLSLMALAWVALGPAQWSEDATSPRGCPRWLRATRAAVNRAVSSAILSCFARVYEFSAVYGNLIACPAAVALVWCCFCVCLLGARRRGVVSDCSQARGNV